MAKSIKAEQRGATRLNNFNEYETQKPSDFEVQWGTSPTEEVLDLFFGDIKESINSALSSISDFTNGISSIISAVENVIEIAAAIADFTVDVYSALVLIIKETLESFLNIFTSVSINYLYHFPTGHKNRRRPNEILYDIGMAYTDPKDPNRPITIQETTFGACLVAMWSVPNIEKLLEQYGYIKKVFGGFSNLFDFEETLQEAQNRFSLKDEVYGAKQEYFIKLETNESGILEEIVERPNFKNLAISLRNLNYNFIYGVVPESANFFNVYVGPFSKEGADKALPKLNSAFTGSFNPNKVLILKEDITDFLISQNFENIESVVGQAPNFEEAFDLKDFGPIKTLIDNVTDILLGLEKGRSIGDRIEQIILILKQRLTLITDLSDRVLKSFAAMIELISFAEGQNIFACYGNGVASDFARAIINAPLHPNYPRSDFSEPDFNNDGELDVELAQSMMFSGAVLLHLGSPDPEADVDKIMNLFKLFVDVANPRNLEASIEQAQG